MCSARRRKNSSFEDRMRRSISLWMGGKCTAGATIMSAERATHRSGGVWMPFSLSLAWPLAWSAGGVSMIRSSLCAVSLSSSLDNAITSGLSWFHTISFSPLTRHIQLSRVSVVGRAYEDDAEPSVSIDDERVAASSELARGGPNGRGEGGGSGGNTRRPSSSMSFPSPSPLPAALEPPLKLSAALSGCWQSCWENLRRIE
mmetsp:Transcript_436/g.1292  ORF Transcript_436/g.1292 Transcript_436/m.1292 type:complete len:201 (+) Transcript_436:1049-1651(+)